jgi:hypothetical protein
MFREHDLDYCKDLALNALRGRAAVEQQLQLRSV